MRSALRAAGAVLLAAALAAPLAAQNLGEATDLAQLLQLQDRRQFDLAALQREAQHPDSLIRAQAALAIGRIGDPAGVPMLIRLLDDPDTTTRADAAFALGLLGDTSAAPELARRMDALPAVAGNPDQLEIVAALARIGGRVAARSFDDILQRHPPSSETFDPATGVALLQAWRLGRLAPAGRLVEYVRSRLGAWRQDAVYSAARLHLAAAASGFLDAIADDDPQTRSYAARGLTASLADSAGVPRAALENRLRALVDDPTGDVRIAAMRSLATFRDSGAAGPVLGRMADADPNAVVEALATLGALGGSAAVRALADRFTTDASFAIRRAALLALAHAAPARAIALGRTVLHDPDWRLRAAYADALGAAAGDSAVPPLDSLAADADPRVIAAALTALGQAAPRSDSSVRRLAASRLAHADVWVRVAAIELLAREKSMADVPRFVAAFRQAERDPDSDARLAAVGALADVAEQGVDARALVVRSFLAAVPRSRDYLVRRYVAARFGTAAVTPYWGDVFPVETGRTAAEYRDIATRLWLPALQGGALPQVSVETERGTMTLLLYAGDAPLTVQSFLDLVARRFFDGDRWHRVVPGFVIQDGDPRGDGNGGPGYAIRDELNLRRYDHGAVGMALSGPDTGGSQFFITYGPQPHLDGTYTVFGHLVQGDDVLARTVQGDRIRRIFQ